MSRIERIIKGAVAIPTSNDVLVKAAQRAIDKKAPFHINKSSDTAKNKNNMADAVIMETYANCTNGDKSEDDQFAFVTHNKSDFGDTNHKNPHPDFASYFSPADSTYFINLVEALRHFIPELMNDIEAEQDWEEVPRSFTEISEAEQEFFDKVWYNRHQNSVYKAKRGIDGVTEQHVEVGRAAAEKKEQQYGKAVVLPKSWPVKAG
ncbi:PIN domain-containing protein [Hymenobacter terricola]|uniref:PIN domain-containing protein n=1 Tax=Hymenobacter terricola TaxID=2819236 RepID=UPI0037420C4A